MSTYESYPPSILTPGAAPTLTLLNPSTIDSGETTEVVITGTNFGVDTKVWVGTRKAHPIRISATELRVKVTPRDTDVGTHNVIVSTKFGQEPAGGPLTLTVNQGDPMAPGGGGPVFAITEPDTVAITDLPGNPGGHTIAEVQAWVQDNSDQAPAVLAAEQARGDDARVTLVAWLEAFIAPDPGDDLPTEEPG